MSTPEASSLKIEFERGTLVVLDRLRGKRFEAFSWLKWDRRGKHYRCHAYRYRDLILHLFKGKFDYTDSTPKYNRLEISLHADFRPFDYQQEALDVWSRSKRGIAVLPTGTGKSFLAAMAVQAIQRSTLILAPTIDLILQWQKILEEWFRCPIGLLGGGSSEIEDITVSTYDSARNYADSLGNRFGLMIFDECHHLPSPAYSDMARAYIAPYRLGLSATINCEEERIRILSELIGRVVYQREIQHLSGSFLSPYTVETIEVELTEEERRLYEFHRSIYRDFRDRVPVRFGSANSWERFVFACYRTAEGREALKSFGIQKQIAIAARNKIDALVRILIEHQKERVLIFTNDNKTAYLISSLLLLPLITHETKAKERKTILGNFRNGVWPFIVNSRILNEGVDVPEANIAVVVSGTSTVREHVQRLGRILRKKEGKRAILYELVTVDTGEVFTSRRRREHGAYGNTR